MEAKYRLVTTWPEDSVQVRDRASNEILVEMKPHELVTMKSTFDQAREALQEAIIMIFNEKCSHQGECGPGKDYCYAIKQAEALAAMEATP